MWGFFNGIFFGWLPFFLPELFETKVRATGAGVSFNYGRILTATTIFSYALAKIYIRRKSPTSWSDHKPDFYCWNDCGITGT